MCFCRRFSSLCQIPDRNNWKGERTWFGFTSSEVAVHGYWGMWWSPVSCREDRVEPLACWQPGSREHQESNRKEAYLLRATSLSEALTPSRSYLPSHIIKLQIHQWISPLKRSETSQSQWLGLPTGSQAFDSWAIGDALHAQTMTAILSQETRLGCWFLSTPPHRPEHL